MKNDKQNFFWPSYADLMTSLFFIMLVLYVLTYAILNQTIKLQKEKLAIVEAVDSSLQPLKKDKKLFLYEQKYVRFQLAFNVKFQLGEYSLSKLENPIQTLANIDQAGLKLKSIIDDLQLKKRVDTSLRNVSYILIIAGYASNIGDPVENYYLSHKRAISLWQHWKMIGIDFEDKKYSGLIDLQISGNGIGGVGRITDLNKEADNQRFLIQIFPKIGDLDKK